VINFVDKISIDFIDIKITQFTQIHLKIKDPLNLMDENGKLFTGTSMCNNLSILSGPANTLSIGCKSIA
jgi:hypothetical protein